MKQEECRKIVLEGAKLELLIHQLEDVVHAITQASWVKRNPYIHSRMITKKLKEFDCQLEACIEQIVKYTGLVASKGISKEKELLAYYYVYEFLFSFHDEIRRQENIHLLLIRNASILAQFERFFEYSKRFIDYQSQKMTIL